MTEFKTAAEDGVRLSPEVVRAASNRLGLKIVDQQGRFELIHKDQLVIDPRYQRETNVNRSRRMAGGWSWLACGTLSVARREDRHYVFDGGHRVAAARLRPDITTLPCMVYPSHGLSEEAAAFLGTNVARKPMSSLDKFRAQLVVGDPVAVLVHEIVTRYDYEFSSHHEGRRTKCVSSFLRWAKDHKESFLNVFPLVVDVCHGEPIQDRVLESICWLQVRLEKQDRTLVHDPYRSRLLALGRQGVTDAAKKAAAYYVRGGPSIWGRGLADALNRGLKSSRIILDDTESDTDPSVNGEESQC